MYPVDDEDNEISHPLLQFFEMRSDLELFELEFPSFKEVSFLSKIPVLDKNQKSIIKSLLEKKIKIKDILKEFEVVFRFDIEIFSSLSKFYECRFSYLLSIFAICYQSISWYLDDFLTRTEAGYMALIEYFLTFGNQNRKYGQIESYSFKKFLKGTLNSTELQISESSINLTLNLILRNQYHSSMMFGPFMAFFQKIFNGNSVDNIEQAKDVILNLVENRTPMIIESDIRPLVYMINPFLGNFDPKCLRILCKLSHISTSESIVDSFMLLPTPLFQEFNSNHSIEYIAKEPKVFTESTDNFANLFEFQDECDCFYDGIQIIDCFSVSETLSVFNIVPENLQEICKLIATCLIDAEAQYRDFFLHSFSHLLSAMQGSLNQINMCGVFIIIMSQISIVYPLSLLLPMLFDSIVFNPEINVFQPDEINESVLAMRNAIFSVVNKIDYDKLIIVLRLSSDYPLLFSDLLMRFVHFITLNEIVVLSEETTINSIIKVTKKLYGLYCKENNMAYMQALSIDLGVLLSLSSNQVSLIQCIGNPTFIDGFFWFIFLPGLTDHLITLMGEMISFVPGVTNLTYLVQFIIKVIRSSTKNFSNLRYQHMVLFLLKTLYDSLVSNFSNVKYFSCMSLSILSLSEKNFNREISYVSMSLVSLFIQYDDTFSLTRSMLSSISKTLQKIEGTEPSEWLFDWICRFLSGDSFRSNNFCFHIKNSQIIPLILSIYGQSKQLQNIIDLFKALCDYSYLNAIALHDGDFDFLMLHCLLDNNEICEIDYFGMHIRIGLDIAYKSTTIIPLVFLIIQYKCNGSISHLVSKLFSSKNHEILSCSSKYFSYAITKSSLHEDTHFLIGSFPSQMTLYQVPVDSFSKSFSVCFEMLFDTSMAVRSSVLINILRITDCLGKTLHFYIHGTSLYISFDTNTAQSSAVIIRSLEDSWSSYMFNCTLNEEFIKISPAINGSVKQSFEIGFERFSGDYLKCYFGGGQNTSNIEKWSNLQMGILSSICLYGEAEDQGKMMELTRGIYKSNNLRFTSRWIPKPVPYSSLDFENGVGASFTNYQNPNDSILSVSIANDLCNSICKSISGNHKICNDTLLHLCVIFYHIFSYNEKYQEYFVGVDVIQDLLENEKKYLTFAVFYSLYSVLEVISSEKLLIAWIGKILMNIWIWIYVDTSDLVQILFYWTQEPLLKQTNIISQILPVSSLIDQYFLLFSLKQDSQIPYVLENSTMNHIVSQHLENSSFIVCRELFSMFLEHMIKSSAVMFDAETVISHLYSANGTFTIETFFHFLYLFPIELLKKMNHSQETLIRSIKFVKSENSKIVIHAICFLELLSSESSDIHSIAVFNEIMKRNDRKKIINELILMIDRFPELYQLLCLLSLVSDDDSRMIVSAGLSSIHPYNFGPFLVYNHSFWYIWPTVLSFYLKPDSQRLIGGFLFSQLIRNSSYSQDLRNILFLCQLIEKNMKPCFNCIFDEFITLSLDQNVSIDFKFDVAKTCFDYIFFHFWPNFSYTFGEYDTLDSFGGSFSLTDFRDLLKNDNQDYHFRFALRLDENHQWIDKSFAISLYQLVCQFDNEEYMNSKIKVIIDYYINRKPCPLLYLLNSIAPPRQVEMKRSYFSFFDSLNRHLDGIFRDSSQLFYSSNGEFDSCYDNSCRLSIVIPRNISLEKNSSPKSCEIKRDRIACIFCCPVKLKMCSPHHHFYVPPNCSPIYEHPVVLLKFTSKRYYQFQLYSDFIRLSSDDDEKRIFINDIYMVLTRRIEGRETAIELFALDGRTYLFDFVDTEHPSVIKALFSIKMPSIQILQKMVSLEVFNSLQITQRWCSGLVSNFEYLMKMNIISGRSFNDKQIYPIFPAIIGSFDDISISSDFYSIKSWSPPLLDRLSLPMNMHISPLEQCVMAPKFVAPDFFFFVHLITEDDELPKWSSNKYEFIYQHRKKLESPQVSDNLHTWIDRIFGIFSKKTPHRRLFIHPHPQKQKPAKQNFENRVLPIDMNQRELILAYSLSSEPGLFSFRYLMSDGTLHSLELNIRGEVKSPYLEVFGQVKVSNNVVFCYSDGLLSICYNESQSISRIRKDRIFYPTPFRFCTSIIAMSESYIFFCSTSTTVCCLPYDHSESSIPSKIFEATSKIVHLSVGSRFKILVITTTDNVIHIFSMRNWRRMHATEIPDAIERIIITESFGFIVVETISSIFVVSIDGEIIRKFDINLNIIRWFQFSNNRSFDYIIFQDIDNKIGIFEAFYPQRIMKFYQTESPAIHMEYDILNESVIIITKDGTIHIVQVVLE